MTPRILSKGFAVAAILAASFGLFVACSEKPAMAASSVHVVTLARFTQIRLHTDRTVVTLAPAQGSDAVQGGQLFLTARGLTASVTPGVIYGVYLDLAPGAVPGANDPHLVGSIGFYDVGPLPSERFQSFDVTGVLSRLGASSGGSHTVTFIPRGNPQAGADAAIAELALVRQ